MIRKGNLPAILVLLTTAALAIGCSRHVFTDQTLNSIDIPGGYGEYAGLIQSAAYLLQKGGIAHHPHRLLVYVASALFVH